MPYIASENRPQFDGPIAKLKPSTAGELNYVISRLCADYIARKGKNYAILNEVMGVLTCASMELYRRVVAPYEESKIELSGDIEGYGK